MLRWVILLSVFATARLVFAQAAHDQTTPSSPPPPTNIPGVIIVGPNSPRVVTGPIRPRIRTTGAAAVIPPAYRPLPDGLLAWDGETQETTVEFGTTQALLTFNVTNVSQDPVTINSVRTSCGCTVPKLPPMPWKLDPTTNGTMEVTMNLAGKRGTVIKTVTITTDKGFKTLYVRTLIKEPPAGMMGESDRMRNLQIASANRQAVFQGDCAACHVTPALNKMGAELYDTACGICHDAEHRSSMVPDLRNLQKETNADYWRTWITSSADGKLMPAFALEYGGILNAMQIDSLVNYLVEGLPKDQRTASASASPEPTH